MSTVSSHNRSQNAVASQSTLSRCQHDLCSPEPLLCSGCPALTQCPRWLKGRTLVVDDHENLVGGPGELDDDTDVIEAGAIWQLLSDVCSLTDWDQVVIGLSSYSAKKWMEKLPLDKVQLVIGDGPDGADKALIDAVDVNHVAHRFDSVVIASGDHIFAETAAALRRAGVQVYNITSSRSGASKCLAAACGVHARLKVGPVVKREWTVAA